jgi:hypothetical protein
MYKKLLLICLVVFLSKNSQAVNYQKTRAGAYTLTKSLTLSDLKKSASIIFLGSFEDFEYHQLNALEARALKFQIKEAIKGIDVDQKTLVLNEWAKTKSPFSNDLIAKNHDYVFFFYQPSKSGFTSLVGMDQGIIEVKPNKELSFSKKLSKKSYSKTQLLMFSKEIVPESYQDLKKFLNSKS